MSIYSDLKSAEKDGNQWALPKPVRLNELLGIPKSSGKKNKADTRANDKPLPQPVRIKDFFMSTETKKSTKNDCARRMTTLPTNNVRRKLYNELPKNDESSDKQFSIISNGLHKTILGPDNNTATKKWPEPVRILGLSKSDGKINKIHDLGRERLKPEKTKHFMESWEKSQTVQPPVRKSTVPGQRSSSVRRKLYSVLPSSPGKLKPQKTCIVETKTAKSSIKQSVITSNGKSVKPEISKHTRKSCLLPPNSIRNKYMNIHQNEKITDEISQSENQSQKVNTIKIPNDEAIVSKDDDRLNLTTELENNEECFNDICETENFDESQEIFELSANKIDKLVKLLSPENSSVNDENNEKGINRENDVQRKIELCGEIPRPSVIMGISAKGIRMEETNISSDSEKSSFTMSRPPLQELTKNSLRPRLDANNTSFEDLLGNSIRNDRGESFYYENLPHKSFLEHTEMGENSFANIDRQTLLWMHGNLKITVQSAEEQLFSMKLILKTLEDVIKNNSNSRPTESSMKIVSNDNLPQSTIPSIVIIESSEKELKNRPLDVDPLIFDNQPEIPLVLEKSVFVDTQNDDVNTNKTDEEDKENVCTRNNVNKEKNDETPRRRSLRLAAKSLKSPKSMDDSFSRIEEELNIIQVKAKRQNMPRIEKSGKRLDPRCRRSIREYMALKSTMNFLQTPDVKGLPTPKEEKDTPSHRRATRRSLSRKLLTELDDLYAESPI